jgi:hypothetical protein
MYYIKIQLISYYLLEGIIFIILFLIIYFNYFITLSFIDNILFLRHLTIVNIHINYNNLFIILISN